MYSSFTDRIDDAIVERPGRIVLAFLVVTVLFGLGLGGVSTAAGTSQFTTDLPAERAFTAVNEDFEDPFATDSGSTQLIQSRGNVLSKPALLGMLRTQDQLETQQGLRVSDTSSAASIVARQLDPTAETTDEQIDAVEGATPREIDAAVTRAATENSRFVTLVSTDFNRQSASASATIGIADHEIPAGLAAGSGEGGSSPLTPLQERASFVVESADSGDGITVFGAGIVASENASVITDSLLLVVPAAVVFIVFFLIVAYRDPVDLLLAGVALGMTIVWTFGFMGLVGIPFSQMLIAVPPLLLAVGIDFGIHAINRYREEGVQGYSIDDAMCRTTDQLLVAFFIVTGTTVIGFAANLTSDLPPIQDFGLVAALGIVFTFLIFGIFLPAAKVSLDRLRERYPIPQFSSTPLGAEGSVVSRALRGGVVIADRAPAIFLIAILLVSGVAGMYATGINTSFEEDDFLPPENNPDWMHELPEPFEPGEYSVTTQTNFLEANFETTRSDSTTVYIERSMERDSALEEIHAAGADPPDSIATDGPRRADSRSIVTVIQSHAERDEAFARLVARNDRDGNGVPDDNLDEVYDTLLASPAGDEARRYMTDDRQSARVVYTTEADASQEAVTADTRRLADRYRGTAIATGEAVVFQAVTGVIFESAITSLAIALAGTTLFLLVVYRLLEGEATLGLANVVPILVTVALLAGTMRLLAIPFNAITATILAITIGLGIDYSVHVVHRFADERAQRPLIPALDRTVRGTGGALLGSMLTTVFGIGVLALALFPALGQFGVLTALSVVYAFLTSVFVLPAVLALWDRYVPHGFGRPQQTGRPDLTPGEATPVPGPKDE